MKTNSTNFETLITFETAFEYLKRIKYPINRIHKATGINRCTLTNAFNGASDKYGKPNKLPEKHHKAIIDFVKRIQFQCAMKNELSY